LLGTSVRPNWRFYGTELDEKNFEFARRNVEANHLGSRIRVARALAADDILPLERLGIASADFTMCNPPFFHSKEDMLGAWAKEKPPSAVCTGAPVEMITEGGDAGFVIRMMVESQRLGSRVQWYTSMLGKLSSLSATVGKLKDLECSNWAVGCLNTGGKTRRWVIGWSWHDARPRNVRDSHGAI
jgi:23S rRNA (adenine1618-N6)-methyltransferase